MNEIMDEKEYRRLIAELYKRIELAFDAIDPDIAECENSAGALTILFADKTKCILSTQPSVRQLWVAVASKGIAFHFNYESTVKKWLDDKGKGIEALSFVGKLISESTGKAIQL